MKGLDSLENVELGFGELHIGTANLLSKEVPMQVKEAIIMVKKTQTALVREVLKSKNLL